jgi:hypothetical protein
VCDDRSHDSPLLSRSRRDQAAVQHARVGRRDGQAHTGGPFSQPARGGSCESGPMQHGALSGGRGALHSSVRVINQRRADDVLCRSERSRAAWLLALVLGVREQPRAALVEPETSCTKLVAHLPRRRCPALGTAGIPALFRVAGGSILKIPRVWTDRRRVHVGIVRPLSSRFRAFPHAGGLGTRKLATTLTCCGALRQTARCLSRLVIRIVVVVLCCRAHGNLSAFTPRLLAPSPSWSSPNCWSCSPTPVPLLAVLTTATATTTTITITTGTGTAARLRQLHRCCEWPQESCALDGNPRTRSSGRMMTSRRACVWTASEQSAR